MQTKMALATSVLLLACSASDAPKPVSDSLTTDSKVGPSTQWRITVLDVPGYTSMQMTGLNDSGLITATACAGGASSCTFFDPADGLLFRNGKSTVVNVPGALGTWLYNVNNKGQVATMYNKDGTLHAAIYDSMSATWTYLPDIPNDPHNGCWGINDNGLVTGCGADANAICVDNWMWDGSKYTIVPIPSADIASGGGALSAVNDRGQVVGWYVNSTPVEHGFIEYRGTMTPVDYPSRNDGSITWTQSNNITDDGIITGAYAVFPPDYSSFEEHGFIYSKGVFTQFDVPPSIVQGGFTLGLSQMNQRGDVVGQYIDGQYNYGHGFLAERLP